MLGFVNIVSDVIGYFLEQTEFNLFIRKISGITPCGVCSSLFEE
nr:hypothetical protein [uncultured Draconibacterium sp.]